MATNYLTRSPGTPTSEKIATMSCWVKVNDVAGSIGLFAQTASSSGNGVMLLINASSHLEFYATNGSSQAARLVTNRKLRDPLAWYLIQCHIDTTQGTSADRIKLYVNGVQETSLSVASYPTQNINLNGFDGSGNQIFGSLDNLSYNCKADIADAYFIDGSIIASNQFWETDATTGQIKPKLNPTIGSFGTNGYHLKFENANAGIDSKPSGASNFSTTGTIRQQVDTPSNVFATLNPLTRMASVITFSHGNNTITTDSSSTFVTATSTIGMSSGKYYFELKRIAERGLIGITNVETTKINGTAQYYPGDTDNTNDYGYYSDDGYVYNGGNPSGTGPTWGNNDIVGCAVDLDNRKIYWHKNGTYINSGNPSAGTGGQTIPSDLTYYFSVSGYTSTTYQCNFGNGYFGTTAVSSAGTNASGNGIFEYDVPTGYTALSTKGLNE